MMLPSEMARINILTHKKYSHHLIENLHEGGLMEIDKVSIEETGEGKIHPDAGVLASYHLRLGRILEILKSYAPKKRGIRNMLRRKAEKKRMPKMNMEEKIEAAEKILSEIEDIVIEKEKRMNEIEEELELIRDRERKLEYFSIFNIPVEYLGESRYMIIKFGISTNIESLRREGINIYCRKIGEKKEEKWVVLIVAHISMKEELNKLKNFEEIRIEGKGMAKDLLRKLKKKIKEMEREKEEITKQLAEIYRKRRLEILAIREEIEIEKERKEIYGKFGETTYTYLIQGWCLVENVKNLKNMVESITDGNCVILVKKIEREENNAPIHLKNPKWAKPFETLLELFSLPKYNEVNPTVFLGISFVIFFSFMLGDAGYGLVIFLLSLFARLKFKESEFIKSWAFIGILLGIGNIITGFIFNSFFGDFIPRFIYGDTERMIYGANIFGISLPIDAIHKPVLILSITLLLGLAHLNLGFILAIYQNIKRKEIKSVLTHQIPWFMLQIGGGMLIGETVLELWHLSSGAKTFAMIFTIVGLIALFKNHGPLGFFEITGYLGDWLSYARLLALGLATAGMALAFNVVAQLLPDIIPYVGVVLVPILLVITHLANLAIQSLGAAIHSLRLQYVEFFNRFYEGGGKKYIPFHVSRKYTEEIK